MQNEKKKKKSQLANLITRRIKPHTHTQRQARQPPSSLRARHWQMSKPGAALEPRARAGAQATLD